MISLPRLAGKLLPAVLLAFAVSSAAAAGPATAPATQPAVIATAKPVIETPTTVDELKKMQKQVEDVVARCLPATVGIVTSDGMGSGIIISKEGLILTAAHVIEKPNIPVMIVFPDGKRVPARTLGTDHATDTGMLKITKSGTYPFVEIGQSSPLKRGEWVVALGHPGGVQKDRPPVARLGRIITPQLTKTNQLDTDCTLIMGDSGGPLFDLEGHLVGIHSRISMGTQSNMHVPIDAFIASWQRLARGDDWGSQASLMAGTTPNPSPGPGVSLDVHGVDDAGGFKVESTGPVADNSGFKEGDIIKKLDGKTMADSAAVLDALKTYKAGQKVAVEVQREGKNVTLQVTLTPRSR